MNPESPVIPASIFVALLAIGGCRLVTELFSPKRTTTTTTETTTEAPAGRDSTVWNISIQDVAGKSGLLLPVVALGWFISKRRCTTALDTVIESIEAKQCVDCKRCVEKRNNKVVNKRVAVVTTRIKANGANHV